MKRCVCKIMKFERIELNENNADAYIEAYISDPIVGFERKAILVIPGGGYSGVCSDREGEPIAQAFIPYGYNAFVLHYTVDKKHPFPTQLIEVAEAIKHIKDNSEKYGISKDKIFVVGFSAGGHLAGCSGILWKHPEIYEKVVMPYGYNKPTGIMLMYPVISPEHHGFSFNNLLCKEQPTKEELNSVSLEKHVDSDSTPAFIFHTSNDEIVNVKNSLCLANAYSDAGVKYELHIYPDAPHGIALANSITDCGKSYWNDPAMAEWVRMAAYWAENIK